MTTTERDLRRLDALVAEKVMGWADVHFDKDPLGSIDMYLGRPVVDGTVYEVPDRFTESWDAAGQVVERMSMEFGLTRYYRKETTAWSYIAVFGIVGGEADSLPLAICLAALRALGVEAE